MLYVLVISRGEEEIEKPDLTVVFYTDIAASRVPVYANRTWSFLHMILSTGPQLSVNLRTSNIYMYFIHFMYTDLSLFHIRIKNICCADCFVAFILLGLLYVPLKCAAWSLLLMGL